jgi:hypothetical protein
MADDRHNTFDSHAWFGGRGSGVPFQNIKGRAPIVWLPTKRFGISLRSSVLDRDTPPADVVRNLEPR